jgi:hypothetical protein
LICAAAAVSSFGVLKRDDLPRQAQTKHFIEQENSTTERGGVFYLHWYMVNTLFD